MKDFKSFLVITHIPFENSVCDFFNTKTEALNFIDNDYDYFHELIEVKSYYFFDINNRNHIL